MPCVPAVRASKLARSWFTGSACANKIVHAYAVSPTVVSTPSQMAVAVCISDMNASGNSIASIVAVTKPRQV